ncbi:MAG: phosphoesterase [Chloroflexota bacterium]|nr:phosphoesterase [Chloroflexota bacterium]MDQ5867581.1 phosphoesterase [Chloroflexota bacterium]
MSNPDSHTPGDPLYGDRLPQAQSTFEQFITGLRLDRKMLILCDLDVDGLGAGVVLWHLLARRGVDPNLIEVQHPPKGENAFTPSTRGYVARAHPRALFVLDLGVSSRTIMHEVPTLLIDHHRPSGEPDAGYVRYISGYDWDPVPTSSLLTYLLCNSRGEVANKAWVAAMGNLGDLGPAHPELDRAAREQKLKWVREATTLLNAAKRSSLYAGEAAFRVLRDANSAREIVEGEGTDIDTLRQCRQEVKQSLDEAKRLAPRFSKTEKVALLEFSSPSRVHPLLAQSWHGRLKGYIVIAANRGFLPGRVAFSARTSTSTNLIEFLARFRHALPPNEMEYGYGHDQATGGAISAEAWEQLKAAMGF